jgi:hypothetical protein
MGIVVDLCADAYGSVLVFDKYPVLRDGTDLKWLQLDLAYVRAEQSASVHRNPFACGNVIQFAGLGRPERPIDVDNLSGCLLGGAI